MLPLLRTVPGHKPFGTPWEWTSWLVFRILFFGLSYGGFVRNLMTRTQFSVFFAHGLLSFKAPDLFYLGHGTWVGYASFGTAPEQDPFGSTEHANWDSLI